jgi:hypothetical protein
MSNRAQSTELRAQGAAVGEEPATTSEKRLADSVQRSGTAREIRLAKSDLPASRKRVKGERQPAGALLVTGGSGAGSLWSCIGENNRERMGAAQRILIAESGGRPCSPMFDTH